MESFNKINGIVEQNQWNRWTKSMDLFLESVGFVSRNRQFDLQNRAQSFAGIYRDCGGNGQFCVRLKEYEDSIAAVIAPYLYCLMKHYIENNKAE